METQTDEKQFELEKDPYYLKLITDLSDGRRLPYPQWIYIKSLYWIRNMASEVELQHALYEIKARMPSLKPSLIEKEPPQDWTET